MVRKYEKINLDEIVSDIQGLINRNIELYVDIINKNEILEFLYRKKKRTRRVLYEIFSNRYSDNLYRNESSVSAKTKNVTSIKIDNVRIFCKEYFINENGIKKKIVMMYIYKDKKNNKDNRWKTSIELVGGYEYDF